MNQYQIIDNKIILTVKKMPFFIRGILFLFSFLFFITPILAMIGYALMGNGLHAGFIFGISLFGLLGIYLLRLALWNTYGKETITINKNNFLYYADYKWFKNKEEVINYDHPLTFSINKVGYEDDNLGQLEIKGKDTHFSCVTKIPLIQLQELINTLNDDDNIDSASK